MRAETRIELRVSRLPEAVRVEAILRDDRGEALADRDASISIEADGRRLHREIGRTDREGRLAADFPLETGSYRVLAGYDGEPSYRSARVEQPLDLSKAHVRLAMSPPDPDGPDRLDRLDLDRERHIVRVRADSPEGGAGLAIHLANELDQPLATGTTGSDGTATLEVRSAALGPPGTGRLVVSTPGDDRRTRATTEMLVVRFRPTRLTLSADAGGVRQGEPLQLTGRLHDSAGPIARAAVGLFAGDEHLVTVLTDDDGALVRDVQLEGADGPVPLTARFASDAPWRPSARSGAVTVRLTSRGATPWWWLLAPMLICAAAIGWLARRGAPSPDRAPGDEAPVATPGIVAGETSARAAERRDVAGTVRDADEGHPVPDGVVTLRGPQPALRTTTDGGGRFLFEDVPAGEWTLRVNADGYEDREARVSIPHRGQWATLSVRLRSLRQLALLEYRPLAEALAPERRWWAFWTARELAERAPREHRPELDSLTEAVERAAYGATLPVPDDVEAIGARAERLARALRAKNEPVSGSDASDPRRR